MTYRNRQTGRKCRSRLSRGFKFKTFLNTQQRNVVKPTSTVMPPQNNKLTTRTPIRVLTTLESTRVLRRGPNS